MGFLPYKTRDQYYLNNQDKIKEYVKSIKIRYKNKENNFMKIISTKKKLDGRKVNVSYVPWDTEHAGVPLLIKSIISR
jgi:hypothetical protein